MSAPAPGPGPLALLSLFFRYRNRTLDAFEILARENGGVVGYHVFGNYTLLLSDPDAVEHVLVRRAENYVKGWSYDSMRRVLGNGLLTSEGDVWREQARRTRPAFHRNALDGLVAPMVGAVDEMLTRWAAGTAAGDEGYAVDLHAEAMDLTLEILTRTLFGRPLSSENKKKLADAVDACARWSVGHLRLPFPHPLDLPTPARRRLTRALREIDEVVYALLDAPAASRHGSLALLEVEGVSRVELRDQVLTLLVAGYESTSVALCWMFVLLAQHHDVRATLERALDVQPWPPRSFEDACAPGTYPFAVVQESLRLYPPAWVFGRHAENDDVIGGFDVPRGTLALISPYVIHRRADLWPEPSVFRPDRFVAGAPARHKCAYVPFSFGSRACIGAAFAQAEMAIVLGAVARSFHVELIPESPIVPDPLVTIGFKRGVHVTLHRRTAHG